MLSSLMGYYVDPTGKFASKELPILYPALGLVEGSSLDLRKAKPFSEWEPWARQRLRFLESLVNVQTGR